MLQNFRKTTLARSNTAVINDSNRCRVCRALLIVACVAICLLTCPVVGQDAGGSDSPTAASDPVRQIPEAEQTENSGGAKTQPAKIEETSVVLKTLSVDLIDKELSFKVPENWKAKEPTMNFIKHDLMLPKAQGEVKDARMTISIVGGSLEGNVDRWKKEFKFPMGQPSEKEFSIEKKTVDGYELAFVQLRGTFMESQGGPMAGGKKTPREDYKLQAVIVSPEGANARTPKCFIKLVGSEKTLKQHAAAYEAMVKSMKIQAAVN